MQRRRHAGRIDVPRLGTARRHRCRVAQPDDVGVNDAIHAGAAIDHDRDVPRQHGCGERRHRGGVCHVSGIEGETIDAGERDRYAGTECERAGLLGGAREDQGVSHSGCRIERDAAATVRIDNVYELEVEERHRRAASGGDHIAQDRHGQAIGDEVQRIRAVLRIHRDRRADRRGDRKRVVVVCGWIDVDQGRRGVERTGDNHVRAGRVCVGEVGCYGDGCGCFDRRAGRKQDVVSRAERDGRTGGLEGYARVDRQVIACPRCFRGGEQDGPGRCHVRADNKGTSGSDGDAGCAAGRGDGAAHRDALASRRVARIGNDDIAAAHIGDARDVERPRRAGRVGDRDVAACRVGCVEDSHTRLDGIGCRADAADCNDSQTGAEDVRPDAGVGVHDGPGGDQRDATRGLNQLQGCGSDDLQVAVGWPGGHIDHSGHLNAERSGEGADHIALIAGQDGLVANALGSVANDRCVGGSCQRDRAGFREGLLDHDAECQPVLGRVQDEIRFGGGRGNLDQCNRLHGKADA